MSKRHSNESSITRGLEARAHSWNRCVVMTRRVATILLAGTLLAVATDTCHASSLEDALNLIKRGKYPQALHQLETLVQTQPDNGAVHISLAQLHLRMAKLESALAACRRAVAVDPRWQDVGKTIESRVAFFRGQDDQAVTHLKTLQTEDSETRDHLTFLMAPSGLDVTHSPDGHYRIYTDEGFDKAGRAFAGRVMDQIYKAYSKVFPFEADDSIVSRVYILSSTLNYKEFSERLGSTAAGESVGYYQPSYRILVINIDPKGRPTNRVGFSADAVDTMFHEGFHQFIDLFVPRVPTWFNEGLAEYFGPSQLVGSRRLRVGTFQRQDRPGYMTRYQTIKYMTSPDTSVPYVSLSQFVNLTDDQFLDENRSALNYSQAWSLIHFMLHAKELRGAGKKVIKRYFSALRDGASEREALRVSFGKLNLQQLEKAWLTYVRKL